MIIRLYNTPHEPAISRALLTAARLSYYLKEPFQVWRVDHPCGADSWYVTDGCKPIDEATSSGCLCFLLTTFGQQYTTTPPPDQSHPAPNPKD